MAEFAKRPIARHDDDEKIRPLPPSRNSSRWEGATRSGTRVGIHFPIQSGDGPIPSERNIWRHFESYKQSAIFHTEQYLEHSAALGTKGAPPVDIDSPGSVIGNDGQVPKTFWDLKAARDNLFNDLEVLQSLSDYMLGASKKGLAKFYTLIAFLTVATSLSNSDANNGPKRLWGPSVIALTAVSGYTGYRISKYGAICLCSGVINSLINRLEHNALDEHDRNSLKGRRFQLLWWTYNFTAQDSDTEL